MKKTNPKNCSREERDAFENERTKKKKNQQELTSIVFVHVAGNTAEDHRCGCSVSTVYFHPIKVK